MQSMYSASKGGIMMKHDAVRECVLMYMYMYFTLVQS